MNLPLSNLPSFSFTELEQGHRVEELAQACRTWGFFKLKEHGIEANLENLMFETSIKFFQQSTSEKHQCLRTADNPWGYYDAELTKNRADWKEIFDLGHDQQHNRYTSRTPWPNTPADFQSVMLNWYDRCENIGLVLLDRIIASLALTDESSREDRKQHWRAARDRVQSGFKPDNSSFLRLNHYPTCETPADSSADFPDAGHLGIYHHTDAGALTVLVQDRVPGLQVRKDDTWHTVDPEPGTLIINVGDLVQVWSNDQYKAPLHRVLANTAQERFSAAFFLNPNFDTVCAPLLEAPAVYRDVNWGEFRASRAAGDYANQGTEVQISDYRY